MQFGSWLAMVAVGVLAGWLAARLVAGQGYGFLGNAVVGVVGAVIAGALLPRLGFMPGGGFFASVFHATLGAVVLLVLIRLVKRT